MVRAAAKQRRALEVCVAWRCLLPGRDPSRGLEARSQGVKREWVERKWRQRLETIPSRNLAGRARREKGSGTRGGSRVQERLGGQESRGVGRARGVSCDIRTQLPPSQPG